MGERKVLFINTYMSRDFEGNGLIAYLLKKHYNVDTIFVNAYDVIEKILHYRPDAVIWDHLVWDFKAVELKLAKKLGCKTFVLPTEGFFAFEKDAVKATGVAHGAGPSIDKYFTWGEWVKNAIISFDSLPESKLIVSGCARFDFYNTAIFEKYYQSREDFLDKHKVINKQGPVIVWAPTSVMVGRNIKTRMRLYTKRSDIDPEEIKRVFDDGETEFKYHSEVVMQLAEKHPDWNFIIKIHPVARVEPYLPIVEKHKNITLGYNTHIRDYLYHCDVLLQRNCTTGTEAWMLNKPVVQFDVTDYLCAANKNYKDGNYMGRSTEDIENFIIRVLNKENVFTEENMACRHDFLTKFYYRIDGKASERVAKVIGEILQNEITDQEHIELFERIKQKEKQYNSEQSARPGNRLKDLLGIKRTTSLRFWRVFMNREKKNVLSEGERAPKPEEISALYSKFEEILYPEIVNN